MLGCSHDEHKPQSFLDLALAASFRISLRMEASSFRVGILWIGRFSLRFFKEPPMLNLVDVAQQFPTEERCRELLCRLRWPNGVECPRCKGRNVASLNGYGKYWCAECSYQFSVAVGTVFQDSHLPLTKWFLAAYLITESRKGISANQVKRMLGISYKSAWYLCHRIRSAMLETEREMLDGIVEIDETYIGGKPRPNRPRKQKQVVIGIRKRGGDLRLIRASGATAKNIRQIINDNVSRDVEVIITDESIVYPFALDKGQRRRHKTIRHKDKVYVSGSVHTNTVENAFSLLKRGIVGTWHKVSVKHLPAYLEEMVFRFNRRKKSDLFLDTLRHMVTAPTLTFEKLTA